MKYIFKFLKFLVNEFKYIPNNLRNIWNCLEEINKEIAIFVLGALLALTCIYPLIGVISIVSFLFIISMVLNESYNGQK